MRTRNVAIVIWNGAEILDWGGPSEVFQAAGGIGSHEGTRAFNVYTVGKTREPITSQGFIDVIPDYSIEEAPTPDIVVFPGGGVGSVRKDPEFLAWCQKVATEAEVALSVCTGAFVLGDAGLLDGQQATTWYGALDALEQTFPKVAVARGARFVDNGKVVTTAGVSAGIDGSLHLVARLLGKYVADGTAQYMEYRWTPESYLAGSYDVLNPTLDAFGRRVQHAGILVGEGNHVDALREYETLLAERPGQSQTWYAAASSYLALQDHANAVAAYEHAAEADELRPAALYGAAGAATEMGDRDRALGFLELAVAAGFDDIDRMRKDPGLELLREDPRFTKLAMDTTP